MKVLATGVAAVAVIATAVGVTSTVSANPAPTRVQLAAVGAPLAPAPAAATPTADQLLGLLNSLADPAVPFASKGNLVEGGIGPVEAAMADHQLRKAAREGQLPLSFTVANIAPAGPGAATADVTASGPKWAGETMNVTFVNQGAWELSRNSVMALMQAASGG